MIEERPELRDRLFANTRLFRERMTAAGFDVLAGDHPIVPVMYGDAGRAVAAASRLLELGIYVVAFSFPVVPRGQARIRVQLSAAHTTEDVERAVAAFVEAGVS
jgi:glycine C-acetyltransferase